MKKKSFSYMGYDVEKLKEMSLEDFAKISTSKVRRKINRGFNRQEKSLLEKLEKGKNNVRTHAREMIVLPIMIDKTISVYTGQEFKAIEIMPEMLGHRLGEFALSRGFVQHGMPGIGSSRSTLHVSMR